MTLSCGGSWLLQGTDTRERRAPCPQPPRGRGRGAAVCCPTPPPGGRAQGHPRGVSGPWGAVYCPTPPPGGRSPGPPQRALGAMVGCHPLPTPPPLALEQDVSVLRGQWPSGERLMVWWHLTGGPGDQSAQSGGGRREPQPGPGAGLAGAGAKGQQVLPGVVISPSTPTIGTPRSLPWDAGRKALTHADPREPAELCRPQAGGDHRPAAPAASPPEGLGALPPSHQHSLPTGLSARRTLLRRPRPACPLIRGYQTLLRRPRPTCPASWALETLFGRPCPTCPLVLGSGSHSSPGPVLPGSQPVVVSGQPGTNPTYKSSGESRFTKMCGPIPGAGWQETMGHLTMMPSPGMPASHTPASTPGELV